MASNADLDAAEKRRLLVQTEPSHAAGIAEAMVIKDSDLYFLCERDGQVPLGDGHGLGLYYRDCRFLSGYELRLEGARLEPLAASAADGFRSIFQLTNPTIGSPGNGLSRERIGVRWRHLIHAEGAALEDEIAVQNYDTEVHQLKLTFTLHADFRDVFIIRGLVDERPGKLRAPRWEKDHLIFAYDGGDGCLRQLRVHFSETPAWKGEGQVGFELQLNPQQTKVLGVSFSVDQADSSARRTAARHNPVPSADEAFTRSIEDWMSGFVRVQSDNPWLDSVVDRALRDLRALRMSMHEHRFFAAGVPWFTALFGRDSLICALQTLCYRREIAAETLRLLALFQGTRVDAWRDEEPGKILHELRTGELVQTGAIPYNPYYGTADATPLFLILLYEYTRWSGELSLFHELRSAVDSALSWIDEHGDHDGDGYVDYSGRESRLINQGWKDSGAAIVDSQGRVAEPPIALVEVQGYVFLAKQLAAELFERAGDPSRSERLRLQCRELFERFNREYWLEDKQFYALALQRVKRPVDAVSSNPGHALWAGIVAEERREGVVRRLMADDMYSGWGIRTLSRDERAYNPIGYHLGTVWPHDTALIAAGFWRTGYRREACRVFSGLLEASAHFDNYRLPELFAGYAREDYGIPVRYPVACHPQAWAAGAVPFLLQSLLGLEPDGFTQRLHVAGPCLPPSVDRLWLKGVRVGAADADLYFARTRRGHVSVNVERVSGTLEISVEEAVDDAAWSRQLR